MKTAVITFSGSTLTTEAVTRIMKIVCENAACMPEEVKISILSDEDTAKALIKASNVENNCNPALQHACVYVNGVLGKYIHNGHPTNMFVVQAIKLLHDGDTTLRNAFTIIYDHKGPMPKMIENEGITPAVVDIVKSLYNNHLV